MLLKIFCTDCFYRVAPDDTKIEVCSFTQSYVKLPFSNRNEQNKTFCEYFEPCEVIQRFLVTFQLGTKKIMTLTTFSQFSKLYIVTGISKPSLLEQLEKKKMRTNVCIRWCFILLKSDLQRTSLKIMQFPSKLSIFYSFFESI